MSPEFEVKVNKSRNAVMCRAVGHFDLATAQAMKEKFKEAVAELSKGYAVITDLTRFQPMDAQTRHKVGDIVRYAGRHGIGCAVRIVSRDIESQISGMQIDKEATGRNYPVFIVRNYAEARQVLGWDTDSLVNPEAE